MKKTGVNKKSWGKNRMLFKDFLTYLYKIKEKLKKKVKLNFQTKNLML